MLDRFAQTAVVFERADANACWTTPSYMSQLTGLLGSAFWSNLDDELFTDMEWNHYYLSEPHWTLAEMLRSAGYRTGAFVDNPKIGSHLGLAQGFEVYDESAAKISHSVPRGGAHHALDKALSWLDGLPGEAPVFLFLQVMDVHGPYLPQPPHAGRFTGDGLGERVESPVGYRKRGVWGGIPGYIVAPLIGKGPRPLTMDTEPIVAAYDEEILATDAVFGELLDALEERGLGDAALVFSADHGEAMLEHESYFSHHTVYQETLHVPLVIRFPDGLGAGVRVSQHVQMVDLFPTLGELAGLRVDREHLHGRSLLPLVRGETLEPAVVHSIGGMFSAVSVTHAGWKLIEYRPAPDKSPDVFLSWPRARALLEERYPELEGLVAGSGDRDAFEAVLAQRGTDRFRVSEEIAAELVGPLYELYDLTRDPLEQRDLAAEHPERVRELKKLLQGERRRANGARIELAEAPVIRPPTEAELEELRELGYVE